MATQYVTCFRCSAQNSGLNTTCMNCGFALPIVPMPMQHMPQQSYGAQEFPGKLQAVSIIQIVAGCLEILLALFWGVYTLILGVVTMGIGLLLIPLPLILLTVGILSLVSGFKGLNKKINKKLSFGVAISQMVLLLGCDFLSFAAGLTGVILLTQDDSKAYFRSIGQG
jgi:hypothetical protein